MKYEGKYQIRPSKFSSFLTSVGSYFISRRKQIWNWELREERHSDTFKNTQATHTREQLKENTRNI